MQNPAQLPLFEGQPRPGPRPLASGIELKNNGMKATLEAQAKLHDQWKEKVLEIIRILAEANKYFTMDLVREVASARGIPEPHSQNCWGAIMNVAAKNRKWIRRTNRSEPSHRRKNHCHHYPVWESLIRGDDE